MCPAVVRAVVVGADVIVGAVVHAVVNVVVRNLVQLVGMRRRGAVLVAATDGTSMHNVAKLLEEASGRRQSSEAGEEQLAQLENENAELRTRAAALEARVAALEAAVVAKLVKS